MWGQRLLKGMGLLAMASLIPSAKLLVSEVLCGPPSPTDDDVENMSAVLGIKTDSDTLPETRQQVKDFLHRLDACSLADCMLHSHGFSLSIAASPMEGAGSGALLTGTAPKGSFLTFYGGATHNPWVSHPDIVQYNDYILTQPNGFLVDGRGCSEDSRANLSQQVSGWTGGDSFVGATQAMGSMANHAHSSQEENSVFYLMTIDRQDYSEEVLRLVPVAYARTPFTFDERYIYAMALVSTRDIKDEMVLTDYNFDTTFIESPTWYTELHPEKNLQRQRKQDAKSMVEKTWEAGSSSF